jgi:Domain of unknown function (DUF4352)
MTHTPQERNLEEHNPSSNQFLVPVTPHPLSYYNTHSSVEVNPSRKRSTISVILSLTMAGSIIVASMWGTLKLVHLLLYNMPVTVQQAMPPTEVPDNAASIRPASVSIGATLSFHGVSITVDTPQQVQSSNELGTPPGKTFLLVSIHLVNRDGGQAFVYNGRDFALVDHTGTIHYEDIAAISNPLGTGSLDPMASFTGEIAFLIDPSMLSTDPAVQIVYLPSIHADNALSWGIVTS